MDYERNMLYFRPIPAKEMTAGILAAIIGVILGGIFLFTQIVVGLVVGLVVGIIGVGIGGLIIINAFMHNKSRIIVTEAEIDRAAINFISDIQKQALDKLGVVEEQIQESDPIQFEGYHFRDLVNNSCMVRKGEDGLYRSSHYNVAVFLFSAEQVYCYEYRFSLVDESIKQSKTDEYFYNDIVSVSTRTDTLSYNVQVGGAATQESLSFEEFVLTTSGGTSISASILDDGNASRSISQMKSLLRDKKAAK